MTMQSDVARGDAVAMRVPDPVFVVSPEGALTYANHAATEVLGWAVEEFRDRSVLELIHPDDLMLVLSSLSAVQGKVVGTPIEIRVKDRAGTWRWLEVIGRDCCDDPAIGGVLCSARDLTRRRMWEVAGGDESRLGQALQHASAIVMLLDEAGVVTSINNGLTRIVGHDPSVLVGSRLAEFAAPGQARAMDEALAAVLQHRTATVEVKMRRTDGGAPTPIRFEMVNLLDDPVVAALVVTGHDVSDLHSVQDRLRHLATHDPLTGLPNRFLLRDRLEALLLAGEPVAVLYIDFDRFKPVNDRLGHDAGDELLRLAAERIRHEVNADDLVARVGGDEFVIVAHLVSSPEVAASIVDRVKRCLEQPFALGSGTARISASIGVALSRPRIGPDELLAGADRAMYAAKGGYPPDSLTSSSATIPASR